MGSLSRLQERVGLRASSNPQYPLAAADSRRAGAHRFQDDARLDRHQERVELRTGAGELDRVALVGDVEDAAAKDVGEQLHLVAVLDGRAHFDEHQFALDVVALGEVDDLHPVSYTHLTLPTIYSV